jgi:hypothetical protein
MFGENLAQEIGSWEEFFPDLQTTISRLWGLSDIMQQFKMPQFCGRLTVLMRLETKAKVEAERHLTESVLLTRGWQTPDRDVDSKLLDEVINALKSVRVLCEENGLNEIVQHILSAKVALTISDSSPTYSVVASQLSTVRMNILEELRKRKFLLVENTLSQYVDNGGLFGLEVGSAFPSAKTDIEEAGNCLAIGCHTAAVFHLMRTVEWGLRAFCAYLGVRKVKKGRRGQLVPLAYAEWERILNQLDGQDGRIQKKIDKYKPGPKKQMTQEFCNSVSQEIRAIKDAWRNHVMHTRAHYEREDVEAIMAHVKRLMIRLASRFGES